MSDMPDMNALLAQAMEMQQHLAVAQEEAANTVVTGTSGGGLVEVYMTATGGIQRVILDPKVVDPNDVAMLEDLIVAAFRDASAKGAAFVQQAMGGVDMGGFGGLLGS
jgi:nucleoid-associated protein EbfC